MRNQYSRLPRKLHAAPCQFDVFPSYKGGHTTIYGGYVWELCPGHPLANLWGFVAQHRLIGESIVGRPLQKDEVVHHEDENRTNNSLSNLKVMTKAEHRRHHAAKVAELCRAFLTEDMVIRALEGRSLKNASRLLGVDSQTIRNRFPELVRPRQRISPTKIDSPRDLDLVRRAAADPTIGIRQAAHDLGMGSLTIHRICRRYNIEWVKKRRREDKPRHKYRGVVTAELIDQMLAAARSDDISLQDFAKSIDVNPSRIVRLCNDRGVEWKRKATDLRKPILTDQEVDALRSELALQHAYLNDKR